MVACHNGDFETALRQEEVLHTAEALWEGGCPGLRTQSPHGGNKGRNLGKAVAVVLGPKVRKVVVLGR